MDLQQQAAKTKELVTHHFEAINKKKDGARIASASIYPDTIYDRESKTRVNVLKLHIVMKKAGSFNIEESEFHQKLEKELDSKVKWHMTNFGEVGDISNMPTSAISVFNAGYQPLKQSGE